jgi:ATP-binding cassette subfamily C protein LapB
MSGPILAFDMNASRGAKLTRITPKKVPADEAIDGGQPVVEHVVEQAVAPHPDKAEHVVAEPVVTPQADIVEMVEPVETPAALYTDAAAARADLASAYAAVLGVDLPKTELLERITADGGGDLTGQAIAKALAGVGLVAVVKSANIDKSSWPALAEMNNGELVLVLEQVGETIVVYDPAIADNRTEVDVLDFAPVFTGNVIRADIEVGELSRRHANAGQKEHWFWGEIKKLRRIMFEVALGSFVANMLAVAVALFSLQVYDRVIPHQSIATLWVLAIGAGCAMLLEAFLRIARARLMDGAGRKVELRIQTLLMDKLLGMQAGQKGQTPSGTFAAVRDFSSVREFFTASTIGTLTDLPFIVLFLALVASIGGNVVWVLFVGGILMVLPSFFMQKKMMKLTMETQGASTKASRLLHEAIYDADTIKAQRGEERFRRLWGEFSALSSLATSEQRKLASTLTFWSQGVQQATYVTAVVVGTFMVFQGLATVGTIIAVGILTSRTLGPLTQLAATLARWSNVKAALEALDQIAEAPQDVEEGRTYLRKETLKGGYELRELTYTYDEDAANTIDIPALSIKPGQHVAILGSNGSGKSTLLKVLSGLHRPSTGRVLIDGVDMGQVMARDLRRGVGYLSQEVRLFAGTLRENLNLTLLERDDERLLASLDFAGLGPFVRNHPKGLDLEIRDGGEGLSIGQRQSIGWSRLWLQDPQVCLLDEPTAALDQTLEATLVDRLHAWLDGRTAIIATHRVPILALTDRTMILQNGRLTVDGPRDEVLAHLQNAKKAG